MTMNWRARTLTAEQLADLRQNPDHATALADFSAKRMTDPETLAEHRDAVLALWRTVFG